MTLKTKCTLIIVGLFIIEILPVPVTSLYSLYAIRKRPGWIPRVSHELYADKLNVRPEETNAALSIAHDPMVVRKNCTLGLSVMFVVDLLIPVVIPTALYVVQKQPLWFKSLVDRLYSDQISHLSPASDITDAKNEHDPLALARIEQQLAYLEQKNFHFARSQSGRRPRLSSSK